MKMERRLPAGRPARCWRSNYEGDSLIMAKAIWNGVVLAESTQTKIVEGNHYFPSDSINQEFFRKSSSTTICPWKGAASYYDIVVAGQTNSGGAWYYPAPKLAARQIKDHVAFWRGVRVES
jgi:uncharacterized protein (DUF427 family)